MGAAWALTACGTVGPDYQPPQPVMPAAWKSPARAAAPTPERWWTLFGDAQLDACVAEALTSNQDVAVALARIDQSRALLGVAAADRLPSVGLDPSLARAGSSRTVLNRPPSLDTTLWRVPFDVSYEIDFWGRVRRSNRAAQLQIEASEDALAALRLSVAAELASTYLQAASYAREALALQHTVELREQSLALIRQRQRAGAVGDLDVLRASGELAQARADLLDVERRRELGVHALAVLIGRAAPEFELRAQQPGYRVPEVPAGLPADLLTQRPDVAGAERQLAASSEQIGISEAARLPNIRLTGFGGFASKDLSSLSWGSNIWSFGPTVSWPVFDGGRAESGVALARARFEEARAAYQKTLLVALREVEDALTDRARYEQRAGHLHEVTQASHDAAFVARARYERGAAGYLDVIDAERTALSSERAEIQNDQSRLAASVALIKALGGGWHGAAAATSALTSAAASAAASAPGPR